jgi:hypothetical protein
LGGRLIGRTADSESANRGSNPRLPVEFFRSVAQRQQHRSYKPEVVGSIPTAPIWGCSQIGKALVLQTRNCGFESRRLHFFRMWDSGRPPVLGTGSRWFNSSHPDFFPGSAGILACGIFGKGRLTEASRQGCLRSQVCPCSSAEPRALVYETRGREFKSLHGHHWLVSLTGRALG